MGEHPIVELAERPALAMDKTIVQFFDFEAAEEVAHGNCGVGRIPVHIAGGAGTGEADSLHQYFGGRGMGEFPGVQTTINQNAIRPPKRIVELDETGGGMSHQPGFDSLLFTPHRPALIKNRVGKKPAEFGGMTVLHRELEVMSGIRFVDTSQFQSEMLTNFGLASGFRFLTEAEIIDPKDALLFF